MSKPSNQILFRFKNDDGSTDIIRRGSDGSGYFLEQYRDKVAMDLVPRASFPIDQNCVAEIFKDYGKDWRHE